MRPVRVIAKQAGLTQGYLDAVLGVESEALAERIASDAASMARQTFTSLRPRATQPPNGSVEISVTAVVYTERHAVFDSAAIRSSLERVAFQDQHLEAFLEGPTGELSEFRLEIEDLSPETVSLCMQLLDRVASDLDARLNRRHHLNRRPDPTQTAAAAIKKPAQDAQRDTAGAVDPPTSPEAMATLLLARDGERDDDSLSLYDAQARYGVSRTALRSAALKGRLPSTRQGGASKQSMYLRRADVVTYLRAPSTGRSRPVAWRAPLAIGGE